jgi:hypothetical protein
MVTVFLPGDAMAIYQKGTFRQGIEEGVKKPAEAGSSKCAERFTWPLGLPWWRQEKQVRPRQPELPQRLGLLHLGPRPALLLGLQGLSRRLVQQALLFCSSRCQCPRPSQ